MVIGLAGSVTYTNMTHMEVGGLGWHSVNEMNTSHGHILSLSTSLLLVLLIDALLKTYESDSKTHN